MAAWRIRKYVPDSDDGEDFTSSTDTESSILKSHKNTDTGFLDIDELANEHDHGLPVVELLSKRKGELRFGRDGSNERNDAIERETRAAREGYCKRQNIRRDIGSSRLQTTSENVYIDDDDVDELQQDRYRATPTTQLANELLQDSRGDNLRLSRSSSVGEPIALRSGSPSLPRPPQSLDLSTDISPLSSPLTAPPSTPPEISNKRVIISQEQMRRIDSADLFSVQRPLAHPRLPQKQKLAGDTFDDSEVGIKTSVGGRAFRQRNPIQLHPYALEDERYRQSLKARGLKPLRITQTQAHGGEREDVDSQEQDFEIETESHPHEVIGSFAEASSSPISLANGNGFNQQPDIQWRVDEEDFSDMEAILHQHSSEAAIQRFKRRKIAHTYSRATHQIKAKTPALPLNSADFSRHSHKNQANDLNQLSDVPLSPPHTDGSSPSRPMFPAADGFRYPPGASFTQLHTPIASSESRKLRHTEIIDKDGSNDGSTANESDSEKASTTGNSYSDDDEAEELQHVQRKIRGVLPASWLRLDLRAQKTLPPRNAVVDRGDGFPVSNEMQRGIARPITTSNSKGVETFGRKNTAIYISDHSLSNDSSSDNDDIQRSQNTALVEHGTDDVAKEDVGFDFGLNFPDVMEDNSIDRMLPSGRTSFMSLIDSTNRQKKLSNKVNSFRVKKSRGLFREHRESRKQQSSISNHLVQQEKAIESKPVLRRPKLGIMDVVSKNPNERKATPKFLQVAYRTARLRSDAGRHSPSRKYLRLATLQDTLDVQETLSMWRLGSVALRELSPIRPPADHRRPLTLSSGNEQKPPDVSGITRRGHDKRCRFSSEGPKPKSRSTKYHLERKLRAAHQSSLKWQKASLSHSPSEKNPNIHQSEKRNANRGNMLSSLHKLKPSRSALLESTFESDDRPLAQVIPHGSSGQITKVADNSSTRNLLLERFLKSNTSTPSSKSQNRSVDTIIHRSTANGEVHRVEGTLSRRRKRTPEYLDTKTTSFRQCSKPPTIPEASAQLAGDNMDSSNENFVIQGLGPFGTSYTTTFNITPLPTGFSFPTTTFVGGGHLSRSLEPLTRSFDVPRSSLSLRCENIVFEWGPWTEIVSSQLGFVMERIGRILRDVHSQDFSRHPSLGDVLETSYLQESVIRYITENLNFLDPIDRISCVQRCKALLTKLIDNHDESPLKSTNTPNKVSSHQALNEKTSIRFFTRSLIMLYQLHHIAIHELVDLGLRDELRLLTITVLRRTVSLVLCNGFSCIRDFHQDCLYLERADREDHYRIESIIVIYHIAKEDSKLLPIFWEAIQSRIMGISTKNLYNAPILDRNWQDLFTLLPLLELDANGVLKTGQRYEEPCENWGLVKLFVEPVLAAYMRNRSGQNPNFNVYLRAVLGRCLYLIKDWGWYKCEMIIGMLFDFYAQNGLAHLQHEENHGSPMFLENLDENTVVEYSQRDRCFHVLLKIIGTGLRGMRRVYPSKKIRDIAWRLMPNHGRSLPKDEAIRQQDLDALRNHHDLLCTLYWASPVGFRPRLSIIRNLVPFESSHREACHISIRTWSNLVKFQISTKEPLSSLDPFAEWHNDMLTAILRQHELARTEIEAQANSSERTGNNVITHDIRELTIARNQRQVEAVLSDALVSLKNAIRGAEDLDTARPLITTSLSMILEKFHAKQPRLNAMILEALDVILAFTAKSTSSETNEDSQGFGDWSGLEQEMSPIEAEQAAKHFQNTILDPLSRLMSNCFGADAAVDDSFLLKVVQTWVSVAMTSINQGIKTWNDYLSPYGHESWKSLRDTEQTRKFTAYFLATIINEDRRVYQEHKIALLPLWMASILERESLLKFQHVLTEAILNVDPENPLLANLPFWVNSETERFTISASDFSERRLSLISSILSNMRYSLDFSIYHNLAEKATLKRECVDLLKHMMTTMKHNYQDLGHGSNIRGAYVNFVQTVVGLLQQHTVEICPIDRFFTDSSAFPLPVTDPTYVVGRLRNYKLRLQDASTSKQLSVFIQAVSERAVVDSQQQYLVRQLHTAMSNEYEIGRSAKLTLRSFLMRAIFPAYIEMSLCTSCGWLLVAPILQAIRETFENIAQDLNGTDEGSANAVEYSIAVFLETIQKTFSLLIDHSGLLEQPTVLHTLTLCYSATGAILPIISYISRLPFPAGSALRSVDYLKSFVKFALGILSNHDDAFPPPDDELGQPLIRQVDQLAEIRSFATNELKETLAKNWVLHDMQYYLIKGNSRRRVDLKIGNFEEEKSKFMIESGRFLDGLCTLPGFDEEEGMYRLPQKHWGSNREDLVF